MSVDGAGSANIVEDMDALASLWRAQMKQPAQKKLHFSWDGGSKAPVPPLLKEGQGWTWSPQVSADFAYKYFAELYHP